MSNYDHDVLGVGNSLHPANQQELQQEDILLTPLELENEHLYKENQILKNSLKELKELLEYRTAYNKLTVKLCQQALESSDNTYIINKLNEIK
jgi:hypothetical protein